MADLEEAPVAAFKSVYVDANVAGCWFHYAQAITKRVQKIGLRDAYHTDAEVRDTVRCLLGLPLLPSADISAAFDDVEMTVTANVSATTSSPPSVDAPPTSDCFQVCLVAPRSGVALVPCGHAQFCTSCVDMLVNMAVDSCCPICRGRIDTVLRIFT